MYRLILNGTTILEGSPKELRQVFDCLSGLTFGRGNTNNWLDKMTAADAYLNYLRIKGKELGVSEWGGELMLIDDATKPVKVHFFDTHERVINNAQGSEKKDKSA